MRTCCGRLLVPGLRRKRKTILNNLRHASGRLQEVLKHNGGASIVLCKANVELQRRAETLTIEEWAQRSVQEDRVKSALAQ